MRCTVNTTGYESHRPYILPSRTLNEYIHISAMWMMPCACLLRSKRWPLALVILRWTSFFGHVLMHILPMKSGYQKSVKKLRWLTGRFQIWVIDPRCGSCFADGSQSCWMKMRLRWKAAFRPVKVDTPVELVKPKTKMKESNATISESKIAIHEDLVENPWKRKMLTYSLYFILSIAEEAVYFHVFPILDAWFEMFCLFQVHVSPGRTTKICLQTCGYQTCDQARGDDMHDMHWYAMNLSCKSWDAGDARWIRRCSGGRAWRCARGTTCTLYCLCWYHFGLMLMLFRPGGITWITGRHRRALWRGMAFGCHHDIMTYTFNTHWHTMTWLTCPDGMKPTGDIVTCSWKSLEIYSKYI